MNFIAKSLAILCLGILSNSVLSQNISKAEYYIDIDPGFGNAIQLDGYEDNDVSFNFTADISMLNTGFHRLYFRTMDVNNNWSSVYIHPFIVFETPNSRNITQSEYFIDTDPGYGNGIQVAINSSEEIAISTVVNSAVLSEGYHKLYFRSKDENNNWSSVYVHPFFIVEAPGTLEIVAIEYFLDEDPGEGKGTPLAVPGTSADVSTEFNIELTNYVHGESHTLYIRAKGSDGNWGFCYSGDFERNYITIYLNREGAGAVSEYGTYDIGETAEVSVSPNKGYTFVNWTESGQEVSTDTSYSFELSGIHDLTANFELVSYGISATAMPSEGGVVTGSGDFRLDTSISLIAIPNEGYRFSNWTENAEVVSQDSILTFTVTEERDLQANFEIIEDIADSKYLEASIFPNPANDFIIIQLPSTNNEDTSITLFDLFGREVVLEKIYTSPYTLDVSMCNKGLYLLQIKGPEGEYSTKVLLE